MLLKQLQSFQEAARSGNFSDAARRLHLTQSAISHQVKALELLLGIKLYERHRRGILLTEAGREVLAHVDRIMAHLQDLEACVNALRGGFSGNIAVAAHRAMIQYTLPHVIQLFKKTYPTMAIQLSTRPADDEIMAMVSRGAVDFGIVTSWSEHRDLAFHEFVSYHMYLCVHRGHPLARRKPGAPPLTLEEVAAEPLLLYERGTSIRKRIDRIFEEKGIAYTPAVETGGAMILKEYAQAGMGAALISGLSIEADPNPDLAAVKVTHLFGKLGYGFVFRKDKFFTTALLDFMGLLDPHFSTAE